MKSKLALIFTILTVAFSSTGCSAEKTFKDKDAGYEMKYDGTVWKAGKNVEIEEEYGTYTYSAVFTSISKTEDGNPAATFKVLKEDLSDYDITDDENMLDDIANKLSARLSDGIVTYQNATIDGEKGYWISITPLDDEEESVTDLIFFVSDESVYEFYYTAVGDENYSLYEEDVNYMLYYFSVS
ncbi:MAG: hypothetical protein LUH47_05855 [Clostridiales bacterium]|nr:hypothetical protein [Clostridiales bacterium]